MEKINQVATRILSNQDLNIGPIQNAQKEILRNTTNFEINALDLFTETVTGIDFVKAEEMIRLNYGTDYAPEKFKLLFGMIKEDKWSHERFIKTVKHFLKHQRFSAWTIADFYGFQIKLYPYSWYSEQISKGIPACGLEGYKVNGKVMWKLKDGETLPFERID